MKEKEGKTIVCQRCQHTWTYKGNAIYYTSCPKCRTSINLRKTPKEGTQDE